MSQTAAALGVCQCGLPMINPWWCSGGHAGMPEEKRLMRCGICFCTVEFQYLGKHDEWHRAEPKEREK